MIINLQGSQRKKRSNYESTVLGSKWISQQKPTGQERKMTYPKYQTKTAHPDYFIQQSYPSDMKGK